VRIPSPLPIATERAAAMEAPIYRSKVRGWPALIIAESAILHYFLWWAYLLLMREKKRHEGAGPDGPREVLATGPSSTRFACCRAGLTIHFRLKIPRGEAGAAAHFLGFLVPHNLLSRRPIFLFWHPRRNGTGLIYEQWVLDDFRRIYLGTNPIIRWLDWHAFSRHRGP